MPLVLVIIVAILTPLFAVVFFRGFGMHDDPFLLIEAAQAWLYSTIISRNPRVAGQTLILDGQSLFYAGFHYLFGPGASISILAPMGLVDFLIRGYPFAVFIGFLKYNIQASLSCVDSMKKKIPLLVFEIRINPGFIDDIKHRLNPVNQSETIYM